MIWKNQQEHEHTELFAIFQFSHLNSSCSLASADSCFNTENKIILNSMSKNE